MNAVREYFTVIFELCFASHRKYPGFKVIINFLKRILISVYGQFRYKAAFVKLSHKYKFMSSYLTII